MPRAQGKPLPPCTGTPPSNSLLPRAQRQSPQPRQQPGADGQTDDSIPVAAVTRPSPLAARSPTGEALAPAEGRTFPSGTALMSAAAYQPPLRLINLITPPQITGEAKLQARGGSGPWGHPALCRHPRNGSPPSWWDTEAPSVGSQGPHEPQDPKRGVPELPPRPTAPARSLHGARLRRGPKPPRENNHGSCREQSAQRGARPVPPRRGSAAHRPTPGTLQQGPQGDRFPLTPKPAPRGVPRLCNPKPCPAPRTGHLAPT